MVEPVCVTLPSVEPKFDPVRYAKSSVQRLNRQTTSMSLIAFPSALLSYIRVPVNLPIKFHPLNRSIQFRPMSQSSASSGVVEADKSGDVLVQYVVLRRDLIDTWPLGSVVTQGCHASVSAICMNKDDALTLEYCSPSNIDSMHKVTLEVKGETQIVNLSEKLKTAGIDHKLWIEQPENIPTCLATKPYHKSTVSSYFRKLKLCK